MRALSRIRPDEFTIGMLATVMLAFLLPCRGTKAGIFGGLAAAAIGVLFVLHGARLSRGDHRGRGALRFGFYALRHRRLVGGGADRAPRAVRRRNALREKLLREP